MSGILYLHPGRRPGTRNPTHRWLITLPPEASGGFVLQMLTNPTIHPVLQNLGLLLRLWGGYPSDVSAHPKFLPPLPLPAPLRHHL